MICNTGVRGLDLDDLRIDLDLSASMRVRGCAGGCGRFAFGPKYTILTLIRQVAFTLFHPFMSDYSCSQMGGRFAAGIQALLSAPNPDDPLSENIAKHWKSNDAGAVETVNNALHSSKEWTRLYATGA
ncbi:hypothetical protein HYC85_012356 [Camellia sinensis]|uniref:UBC core domain-containing protein n=1 Tax=Camellia sinensis TaxID=4442 RepID=A0A7J7HBP4_CAMSI|nr:hypothetical protein HYC85_012356 [Camellia sinensis]